MGESELEILTIKNSQVNDMEFMRLVVKRRYNLKSVSVRRCSNLTDRSFEFVAAVCPYIQVVRLNGCPLLSPLSVMALKASRPNLTVEMQKCAGCHGTQCQGNTRNPAS